jgi:hypothetical protein
MKKRIVSALILLILLVTTAVPVQGAPARGVDRSKIGFDSLESYPLIITVGELSFAGELARGANATKEDIEKAIEKTLKESGKTEAEIGEAEAFVEKVARDRTLAEKAVGREIRDVILKNTGLDLPVEIIEHVVGLNDRPLDEFLLDTAVGAAQDKAAEVLLKKAGGPVIQVTEALMFLSEKYEQDKQRWKDRVDAINAKRMLKDFYDKANYNLKNIAGNERWNWRISMDATDSRYFTFFEIPGNLEMWTFNISLEKQGNIRESDRGPFGLYTGSVEIYIKTEMSKFDEGIKDKYQDWIEGLYAGLNQELGLQWTYKSAGAKTEIERKIGSGNFYLDLSTQSADGVILDLDSLGDTKLVIIDRKVERSGDNTFDNARFQAKDTMTFWANRESNLQYTYDPQYFNITVDGETLPAQYAGVPMAQKVSGEVPWDSSVWDYWDKNEKKMKIIIPHKSGDEGYFPRPSDVFKKPNTSTLLERINKLEFPGN